MRFAVVGDCLLDVTVAPSAPIRPGADAPAGIGLGPGGQAANVAVRLARRGASVRLIAPFADDAAGRLLREAMAAEPIELDPLAVERTGMVVALLEGGERTMLSERAPFPASASGTLAGAIADAGWIHCSGYALLDAHGPAVAGALARRPAGAILSIGGCAVPPEGAQRFRDLLAVARPELLVVNRAETASTGSAFGMVATDPDGSSATIGSLTVRQPALARSTVDATGAGDAYAAALILALSRGSWPPAEAQLRDAMRAGAELAGLVAGVVGAQGRVAGEH
jgi:sugar/nucleoside kinase (ribokinase family)